MVENFYLAIKQLNHPVFYKKIQILSRGENYFDLFDINQLHDKLRDALCTSVNGIKGCFNEEKKQH